MRYASVCDGIGAVHVAWKPLGWECAWTSEIDRFPIAVVEHHWKLPNVGDMTRITDEEIARHGPVSLLVGGTPCQSFSVAGLRKGLADPRGNLALAFLALLDRLRPRWVVWENVPGVRSSSGGRDLGAFLGGLGELGYGWAYRSLDAQYFDLAQQRERVFVVGCLGDGARARAVLFERESLLWNPPPSREAGDRASHDVAPCLRGRSNASHRLDTEAVALARCVTSGEGKRQDYETTPLVTHALRGEGFDASEDGSGRGTPLGAVAIQDGRDREKSQNGLGVREGLAYTVDTLGGQAVAYQCNGNSVGPMANIRRGNGGTTGGVPFIAEPVAFHLTQDPINGTVSPCVSQGNSQGCATIAANVGMRVRRLTPREVERLQGFPDDWTLVPYRGKPATDSPRYKALGNSMAVPCMRWIGERIAAVDAMPSLDTKARIA